VVAPMPVPHDNLAVEGNVVYTYTGAVLALGGRRGHNMQLN